MDYFFNFRNFYKIWFSNDPDQFAGGIENELRLIRQRLNNPDATINFVYDSECLSTIGMKKLQDFCQRFSIIPVDINDLQPLLTHKNDRKMFALAKKEILFAKRNRGGNLAAASDCARLIIPLIEKCGIYSDMDVELNFSDLPPIVQLPTPVLLPVDVKENGFDIDINNDFLGLAVENIDSTKLCDEAYQRIRLVQQGIFDRYANPPQAFLNFGIAGFKTLFEINKNYLSIIKTFFKKHPKSDIFAFRRYFENYDISEFIRSKPLNVQHSICGECSLDDLSEHQIKTLLGGYLRRRRKLDSGTQEEQIKLAEFELTRQITDFLMGSVTLFSGPACYYKLYQDEFLKENFIVLEDPFRVEPIDGWTSFASNFNRCSLTTNNLMPYIDGQNLSETIDAELAKGKALHEILGEVGDQSWLRIGREKKRQREQNMEEAATLIQRFYRSH